jgi:hypothetical protein
MTSAVKQALKAAQDSLERFAARRTNGQVTIHFAAGVPRKIDYSFSEPLSFDEK